MNKVEGKVADFCPNCKNCKGMSRESNGVHDWLTEVKCEDPYDGMAKTLDADSNVCCSMFESKEDKLMQYYREKSKNYEQILIDISRFVPVDVIYFKDLPKIIEQMRKTGDMYDSVSESYDALFDQKYELQKANKKLEDKLNRAEKLLSEELGKSDSWKRDYERLRDQFIYPIYNILYPDNPNRDINVTDLINDIKNLKIYAEENETMYNDLKHWKERCHKAETNVTTLNSKVETLKNKNDKYLKKIIDQQARDYKQCARIMDLEFAVNKLQSGEYDDVLAKDIEIKSLQAKYEDAMNGWNHTMESYDRLNDEIDKLKNENTSLNTINKGLAEDRTKLINYIRSLKIASENYLKEFTYEED